MNLTKVLHLVLFLILLSGCHAVYSTNPVGEAPVAVSPGDWEGTWVYKDGAVTVAVLDKEKGVLEVGWVEKKQNRLQYEHYKVLLRQSGEWLFGNVQDPDRPKLYVWGRIRSEDGQIILWVPDVEKARALVEKGVLPGRAEKKDSDVVLSNPGAAEFMRILSGEKGALLDWERPLVFRRLPN